MSFDLESPVLVLAGTLYGEARGCGSSAMENVAQVILNRAAEAWDAGGIVGVCLAPWQFSCWNATDPNRTKILDAPAINSIEWRSALAVATAALAGKNPDRVCGADSYFARSMTTKPRWARAPARQTFSDGWHNFWQTRAPADAPNESAVVHGPHFAPAKPLTAAADDAATDALNDASAAGQPIPLLNRVGDP